MAEAMRKLLVLFLISTAWVCHAFESGLTLTAAPGKFVTRVVANSSPHTSIRGRLTISESKSTEAWPTAAYIGVQQDSTNDSAQIFVLKNEGDDYLTVGYRIIIAGTVRKLLYLGTIDLGDSIETTIAFDAGKVSISINGKHVAEEQTLLNSAAPYIAVSSGTANFEFVVDDPEKVGSKT